MRQIKKGSINVSVDLYIIDSTTGQPELGVLFNSPGIDLEYRRDLALVVPIVEVTIASLSTAHTDGGFLEIGHGYYRLDIPDAAFVAGASKVTIQGVVSGMIVLPQSIQLVSFDPEDAADLGLSTLTGNIPQTADHTAGISAIPTTAMRGTDGVDTSAMRGTDGANTTIPPNAGTIASAVQEEALAGHVTAGTVGKKLSDIPITAMRGTDGVDTSAMRGTDGSLTDKAGFSLSAAGILAIWHQLLTGITTPSTIGKLIKDFLDATISSRNAVTPNIISPPTLAELNARTILSANYATISNQSTILNRLGAFTGSGINNILGFFQAIFKSDAILPTDMGGTGNPATDSLQAIRDRGDVGWITGGAGGISDILNVVPLIPGSIDLANTATVRLGLMLINSLDDLPSIAEISPGTISIEHKAIGGASWLSVVTNAACLESAGLIYFDEVFDAASGYSEGDSIRVTFKSQKITVALNDFEITDATGRIFYSEMRQTTGAGVADWNADEKSDIRGALGVIGTKTTGIGGQIQTLPTFAEIWETALTESYAADNVAPTPAQFLNMLYSVAAQSKLVGNKLQTQKLDGATLAMEFTLDDPNNATSRTRTL